MIKIKVTILPAAIAALGLGMATLSHPVYPAEIIQRLPSAPVDPVIEAAIKCMREHTSYFSRQGKPLEVALQAAADLCFDLGSPVDDLLVTSAGERPSFEVRRTVLEAIRPATVRSTRRDFQSCVKARELALGKDFALCEELLSGPLR
jgi:hypothetical protein